MMFFSPIFKTPKVQWFLQFFWLAENNYETRILSSNHLCNKNFGKKFRWYNGARDLLACFMEKIKFQLKTSFIFIFYCGTVLRENWMKLAVFFLIIFASKIKLADGFMILRGIKLWNRQSWSGKKMKLTTRGCAAAVSFIFFPTDFGRFHNFSPLKSWNHSQFHFWAKITEKMPPVSPSFTWNWPQKKMKVSL